jgi:Fe-S cluster assembly scaffold protein SufB
MMRIGGKIVSVSERHDVLREAAEARALARAVADSVQAAGATAVADSLANAAASAAVVENLSTGTAETEAVGRVQR